MKIAFVNQPFDGIVPPLQNSIGLWTYHIAPHVAAAHAVTVLGKRTGQQTQWTEQRGVSYHFVTALPNRLVDWLTQRGGQPQAGRRPSFASRWYRLDYIAAICRELRRLQPDIVHIHNFSQFVEWVRAYCPRTRIVLHMNGEWLTQLDYDLVSARIEKTDLVLGSSDYLAGTIRQRFPEHASRIHTIHNGVDASKFCPGTSPQASGPHPRLLFVGRVSPEKGVHVLIEAFSRVAEHYPQATLTVVGPLGAMPKEYLVGVSEDEAIRQLAVFYEGDYPEYLRESVPAHLAGQVTFTGGLPQSELIQHYRAADVLINPSFSESFGMSLVESLACRRPVVATRVGGMVEIVEGHDVGVLVPRGDADALATAILDLLADDAARARMGANGRCLVESKFAWPRVAETLMGYYAQLAETAH